MMILKNVSKKWGDRIIVADVSYHFPEKARIALVGPNGTGKTTLLNILCGMEEYDTGTITYPGRLRLGYMPQIFEPNPKPTTLAECMEGAKEQRVIIAERERLLSEMENNFSNEVYEAFEKIDTQYYERGCHRIEHEADTILAGLGFTATMVEADPRSLSGGWRMRLELAKILMSQPNFLILDEPTNHLDLPSIQFFEDYMREFQGTLLFVSHDRDLVNRLATYTMCLRGGLIQSYPGNLDALLQKVEENNALTEKSRKHLQARSAQVQRFVDRFRASPSKAKMVQSRVKMLERLRAFEDTLSTSDWNDDMEWTLPEGSKSGNVVWSWDQLAIGYNRPLTSPLTSKILRGWRVAVTGANGLGKSTLLKTLCGVIPPLAGTTGQGMQLRLGYFAQENSEHLNPKLTILENVMDKAIDVTEFQVRSLLGMLGISGQDAYKKVSILSGGEKSRVALAQLWVQKPNTLLLDEPTNHLDMASEEALALALERFSGTVIFVSHNRHFISAAATHVLWLDHGGKWTLKEAPEKE